MNFIGQMIDSYRAPESTNVPGAMLANNDRLQRYLSQGMTPEQAQALIAKEDALRAAAQRPNPGSAYPMRVPTAVIGVRG